MRLQRSKTTPSIYAVYDGSYLAGYVQRCKADRHYPNEISWIAWSPEFEWVIDICATRRYAVDLVAKWNH